MSKVDDNLIESAFEKIELVYEKFNLNLLKAFLIGDNVVCVFTYYDRKKDKSNILCRKYSVDDFQPIGNFRKLGSIKSSSSSRSSRNRWQIVLEEKSQNFVLVGRGENPNSVNNEFLVIRKFSSDLKLNKMFRYESKTIPELFKINRVICNRDGVIYIHFTEKKIKKRTIVEVGGINLSKPFSDKLDKEYLLEVLTNFDDSLKVHELSSEKEIYEFSKLSFIEDYGLIHCGVYREKGSKNLDGIFLTVYDTIDFTKKSHKKIYSQNTIKLLIWRK